MPEPAGAAPLQPFSLTAFRSLGFDHKVAAVIDAGLRLLVLIEGCRCVCTLDNQENRESVLDELRAEATRASQMNVAIAGWWLDDPPTWDSSAGSFNDALCGFARRLVCLWRYPGWWVWRYRFLPDFGGCGDTRSSP